MDLCVYIHVYDNPKDYVRIMFALNIKASSKGVSCALFINVRLRR